MSRLPAFTRLLPLSAALLLLTCGPVAAAETSPVAKVCPSGQCLTEAQKRKLEVQPDPTERTVRDRDQPQVERERERPQATPQNGGQDAPRERQASDRPN